MRLTLLALLLTTALASACSVITDFPDDRLPAQTSDAGTPGFVPWTQPACSQPIAAPPPPLTPPGPRVRYPGNRTLSPITPRVVDSMLRVAARSAPRNTNVFMRVGDSISVNANYLNCFTARPPYADLSATEFLNLGSYRELRKTIDYFSACVAGTTPFERVSLTCQGDTGSAYPLGGSPPRLEQEDLALNGQFALVMYGTNDIGYDGAPASHAVKFGPAGYPHAYLKLVDTLIGRGIVPILSTIPPKTTSPEIAALVPSFNAVVRAVAEARQIPLLDFNRELLKFVDLGLAGDGTHLYSLDARSCNFRDDYLAKYPYNVRNLITLQMLERVRKVFVDKAESLDDADPTQLMDQAVDASPGAPWVIPSLPFSDLRPGLLATSRSLTDYSGCPGAPAQPGPETVYRFTLTQRTPLRAFLTAKNDQLPYRLNLLAATPEGSACIASAPTLISKSLAAGTYYFVVDTEATALTEDPEYLFVALECEAGDVACN